FRVAQVQARHRPDLRLGQYRHRLTENLSRQRDQTVEVRARDLNVDHAARIPRALEQARLLDKANRPRKAAPNVREQRQQLAGALLILRAHAVEGLIAQRDKEKLLDAAAGLVHALLDRVGPQPLHLVQVGLPHIGDLVDVVARRRQQNAKKQVLVALRQILRLRD